MLNLKKYALIFMLASVPLPAVFNVSTETVVPPLVWTLPKGANITGFSESLALVRASNDKGEYKYGYVDCNGEVAIEFLFDNARVFSEGLAAVYANGFWGYINKSGQTVGKIQYDKVSDFTNGFAVVSKNGKFAYIKKDGNPLTSFKYDSADSFDSYGFAHAVVYGHSKYINNAGKEMAFNVDVVAQSDGLFRFYDATLSKSGYMNSAAKIVIPARYIQITDFLNGRAYAKVDNLGSVLIDKAGKVITPSGYYAESSNIEYTTYIVYNKNKQYKLMNRNGKLLISSSFNKITPTQWPNIFAAKNAKGLWGYIDENGKTVVPFQFKTCDSGYASAETGSKRYTSFINNSGQVIKPPVDGAYYINTSADNRGFLISKLDGGSPAYYFCDYSGKLLFTSYKEYSAAGSNTAICDSSGKYGVVNNYGEQICPFIYRKIYQSPIEGTFLAVTANGTAGLVSVPSMSCPLQGTADIVPVFKNSPETESKPETVYEQLPNASSEAMAVIQIARAYHQGSTAIKAEDLAVHRTLLTSIVPDTLSVSFNKKETTAVESYLGQEVIAKADQIIAKVVKPGASGREKAKALHDWLVANVYYASAWNNQYSSSAILGGRTVCSGYAAAYQVLCQRAGLTCLRVGGYANGGPHEWNVLLIDNTWLYVDVTFDDPLPDGSYQKKNGKISTNYFLVTDKQLSKDHQWTLSENMKKAMDIIKIEGGLFK